MKRVRAKLFQNGGSQAVRLPKECRFPEQEEVVVHRQGRRVILEPADEWPDEFRACLGAWSEEIARPPQTLVGRLWNPLGNPPRQKAGSSLPSASLGTGRSE